MKKGFRMFAAACAATVAAASLAACNNSADGGKFRIGLTGPLTGGAAIYGEAVRNGVELAIEEINAAGGLDGTLFSFNMPDDAHKADKIPSDYASLQNWGMQMSLGSVTSTPCLEFKNYAVEDELFFLTPSATNDTVPADYDRAFQMCFKDSKQGYLSAEYIKDNCEGMTVGVLYNSEDAYSKGLFENFRAEFTDYSFTTATFIDSTTDFASQIEQLKNCDFIYMPIYYTPASIFILQAKGKISDDAIYFGCDGFDGIDSHLGENINTFPQEVSMLSHFNSADTDPTVKHFVDSYTEKYGTENLNQFGASAYDCVYAIFAALKKAKANGKDPTPSTSAKDMGAILKEVFTSSDFSFDGVTGKNVTWETNGEVNKQPTKYIVKEHKA